MKHYVRGGETCTAGSVMEKGHRHPICSNLIPNLTKAEVFTSQFGVKAGQYTKEELEKAAKDSGVTVEFQDELGPRSVLESFWA